MIEKRSSIPMKLDKTKLSSVFGVHAFPSAFTLMTS